MGEVHVATLWIGDELGPLELASLHSLVTTGHRVTLYSYTPIPNMPAAIVGRDANEVLPATRMLVYKGKRPSPALHSNLFRYALIARTDNIWVDLDVIALKPLRFPDERVYGLEKPGSVNCAVLRLPAKSPVLADLLAFREDSWGVPPQITGPRRIKYWIKTFGRGYPIESWPWGSTGPKALTAYLEQHDEIKFAMPIEVFYPVPIERHVVFLEPGGIHDGMFGPDTHAIHLWASSLRETIRDKFGGTIPPDSYLGLRLDAAREAGFIP